MTPRGKTPEARSKTAGQKRRSRPSIASLSRDLLVIRKERDALALQMETARRALTDIAGLLTAGATNPGVAQALTLATSAAQSIDVSALLTEIRSTARLEASEDTARLNALDSLVSDGGVGFGWEQIRGTFIRFTRITPADRTRVGFSSPLNTVRTLLDEVIREERTRNQQKTIFVSECKPTVTDRKRSGK